MDKLNLTPAINIQRPDKNNKYAIRIRCTIKRKVKYYSTGLSVLKEQFENKEVIKHPNKVLLNASIRKRMSEIEKSYLEGNLNIKKPGKDFYKFCDAKIKQQKGEDAHGTWKHKKSYLKMLKGYKPGLQFTEITPSFMLDFENHCRSLGNKPTTVWSKVKFITTMINAALADKVIFENPKEKYKTKSYVNPERNFLTAQEIEAIEKFANESNNKTLIKVADWFLFGCYTGLRYADVKNFDRKKIINGRVILRTEKKHKDVSIKLHQKLEKLLERMEPGVFTNQEVNAYLKIIAAACNIEKNITFHVSRHSFAIYFLTAGGSIETLSKILGHSSIKTTQIYGKVINLKIDNEMDKVWG